MVGVQTSAPFRYCSGGANHLSLTTELATSAPHPASDIYLRCRRPEISVKTNNGLGDLLFRDYSERCSCRSLHPLAIGATGAGN